MFLDEACRIALGLEAQDELPLSFHLPDHVLLHKGGVETVRVLGQEAESKPVRGLQRCGILSDLERSCDRGVDVVLQFFQAVLSNPVGDYDDLT